MDRFAGIVEKLVASGRSPSRRRHTHRIPNTEKKQVSQRNHIPTDKFQKTTHPVVTPQPFSLSTLISNSTSPVRSSHSTRHQFRLPMMNFCFLGCPVGSFTKIGCWKRSRKHMRAITSGKEGRTYHCLVCIDRM